jgi:hypothetical protein
VMVAAAVVLVLVARNAIVKSDFAGQAAFGQQFQSTVDSSETDARIFLLHQPVKFVGREVRAGFEKSAQDGVALRRLFQADSFQMLMQYLLRFADHLRRDAGLIVNALLQHADWYRGRSRREQDNTGVWKAHLLRRKSSWKGAA